MSQVKMGQLAPNGGPAQRRWHYAWVIAFAGLLVSGAGVGIFNSTLGVFVKPVCEELGFMRGQFTLYSSISTLVCVALMPLFGTLFKRFGFRRIAVIGAVVCGLALVGYSFSSLLWQFYLLSFLSGLLINGVGIMSVGILINRWFADRKGLATGIAYSGSGLLAAILIPISNRVIELNGWRWGYRFLACVSLCVLIPVILLIIKDKPSDKGLEPYSLPSGRKNAKQGLGQNVGLTRKEALKKASFWALAIGVLGITLCQAGPHVHTVSFLSDIGYSSAFAASVSSVYMLLLTACKIIMGYVIDRLGSLKASLLIGGSCIVFPVVALFAIFPAIPWVYAAFLAVASSGSTILSAILTTNYFGGKDFSRVYSVVTMFMYGGVAISSPLLGSLYDLTGGYTTAWILIACIGVFVCVCLIAANKTSKSIVFSHEETAPEPAKELGEHITAEDSVLSVVSHPAFQGFGRFLFPLRDKMPDPGMTVADSGKLLYYHAAIDVNTTVGVINAMLCDAKAGRTIFYDIHSAQDKENYPQTKNTGLFFFRGKPGAPFAIISPGGAFKYVGSIHESFPLAWELSKRGYNAFALQYRTGSPAAACEDLACALSFVWDNAEMLEVSTGSYSLWGGSAGARMAAYLGSYGAAAYGGGQIPKPGAVIMQYTSHSDYTVNDPPTFAVIGEDDSIASPTVMEARVDALKSAGVDAQLSRYPNLGHGFGLGLGTTAEGWLDDAELFWKRQIDATGRQPG